MKVLFAVSLLVAMTLAEPPSYRQQFQPDRTYYFAKQQEIETAQGDAPYQPSGWKPDGPAFELPQKQQRQEAAAPANQYGAPAAPPQNQYGPPAAPPQNQYGAPVPPQRQYGAPAEEPENQYGAPAQAQAQFRAPARLQKPFGAQPQFQRQYAAPAKLERQYAAPAQPQNQYGAPAQPQNQYGAPTTPQQEYGTPSALPDNEEATTVPTGTESQAEPVDSVNELEEEGDVDEQQRQTGEYYIALPDGRLQRVQYVSSQDIAAMKYFAKIRAENVEPLRGAVYAYQPLQKLEFAPARLQLAVNEPVAVAPSVQIREPTSNNQRIKANNAPAKLEVQPLAAELGSSPVVAPVSSSYTTYTANYQVPDQRYLVTF